MAATAFHPFCHSLAPPCPEGEAKGIPQGSDQPYDADLEPLGRGGQGGNTDRALSGKELKGHLPYKPFPFPIRFPITGKHAEIISNPWKTAVPSASHPLFHPFPSRRPVGRRNVEVLSRVVQVVSKQLAQKGKKGKRGMEADEDTQQNPRRF
jgi:hypothetical protein